MGGARLETVIRPAGNGMVRSLFREGSKVYSGASCVWAI
jgi:hypothetical protein